MPSADKRQRKKENARMARQAREAAAKRRKRLRSLRNGSIVAVIVVGGVVLINLLTGGSSKKAAPTTTTLPVTTTTRPPVKLAGFRADPKKTYTATIVTNFGTIIARLDAKNAPIAAGRFIELARKGFYNGLTWHRVAKDFMIQGGDPLGDGTGTSGNPPAKGEVPKDHYPVGALAAAKTKTDAAGTFDSQFFIVTGSGGKTLDNLYARFGTVTSGLPIAKKIESLVPANGDGPPTQSATIIKVTITES